MGGKESKIPPPIPGHLLGFTGIEEFDKIYKSLEHSVKKIKEAEIDLNMHTTDFIRSLGAKEVWETKPDVQKLIQVLLVIISAESYGSVTELIEYTTEFPYLIIHREKLSKNSKKVANNFKKLIDLLQILPKTIVKSVDKLNGKIDHVRFFQNEVSKKTISLDYSMRDKLTAINISVNNYDICENALKVAKEIERISEEVIMEVYKAVKKVQVSPHCEILASRGLQASSEGLTKPKSIVNKFWPLV
ncbi:hypothetical protein SteCoe_21706 [Stentor coeruleus]|uniref:Uncharacterized protein n=1 Tax=Stentor coeruleus TaxID=5963 RepID=A0A1R2BNW8_9CILI|nr:hypothetical protein SteCoe_21706 [Stentor coeruleus]